MLDFPDEDSVVPGFNDRRSPAFQRGETAPQQGRAGFAWRPIQPFKTPFRLFSERNRNAALRFAEHIDRKVRALPKM